MFAGVEGMAGGMILAGIIWAVALGFAAGNYACSLVHRLPRKRGILEKKPYCGSCGTMLATKDLFPVISALLLRHKCRYCGAEIPKSHFWTEILIGALFILSFLAFSFGEMFVLNVFLGTFLVVLASIENNEGYLQGIVLVAIAAVGMVLRTLVDGSIYGFAFGAFFGLIVGALVWRKQVEFVGHRYTLPDGAKLAALGGLCVGELQLVSFFVTWLVLRLIQRLFAGKEAKPAQSVPFGLSVMVHTLYPYWLAFFLQ